MGTGPLELPHCTVWFDAQADADEAVFADGDAVSTWLDRSGEGNHATAPSSTVTPFFYDPSGMLGLPALKFSGAQYLELPGNLFAMSEGATIAVAQHYEVDSNHRYIWSAGDSSSGDVRHRWYQYSTTDWHRFAVGPDTYTRDPVFVEDYDLTLDPHVFALRITGTEVRSWLKCGNSFDHNAENEVDAVPGYAGAAGTAKLGSFFQLDSPQYLKGYIGEFVHFDSIDANDFAAVVAALARKWGVVCGGRLPTLGSLGFG